MADPIITPASGKPAPKPDPQPQQQGQSSGSTQQQGGQPVFRDWASI